jgi:hypothetical protein
MIIFEKSLINVMLIFEYLMVLFDILLCVYDKQMSDALLLAVR